ncbi:MAG: hypothetical protein ACC661_12360, partial [Verrucomicrobiales bacterium]
AVAETGGHDFVRLEELLGGGPLEQGKPSMVIARTVKGKSYMEDETKWHHGVPSEEQYALAMAELDAAELQLREGAAK